MEERLIINQRTHLKMQLNVIRICQFELIMMDQIVVNSTFDRQPTTCCIPL